MKKFLFTITLFATLALWGSCTQEETNQGEYAFTGTVVDVASGEPKENVPVMVTNGTHIYTSTKTDANGMFKLYINIYKIDNQYYILIGDEISEQKRVEIRGFSSYETNLGTIELQWQVKPQIHTLEIEDMDYTNGKATLRGKIEYVGRPEYKERGFVWSTTPQPTINDNIISQSGTGTGTFSSYVTGLPKNKIFYVRAYAKSDADITYGNQVISAEYMVIEAANLMVQTKDLGKGDWSTAISMCKNSIVGGYTDWRLPKKEELMTLYNNREKIGGFTPNNYWSSSFQEASSYAYYISFSDGSTKIGFNTNSNYVRAVRTIE